MQESGCITAASIERNMDSYDHGWNRDSLSHQCERFVPQNDGAANAEASQSAKRNGIYLDGKIAVQKE